ncbi:MAG: prolipoprotein diacylglyceryl transferase [Deltaproteobacteria bacterium]|nr:prolipoprotein diacylglyceryl transferase [Deltaproteobacteria bacterium]
MYPVLFHIGSHPVTSYGLAMGIGALMLIPILRHLAPIYGQPASALYDLAFWAIAGAVTGARLLFVIVNRTYFSAHPMEVFALSDGGLDFLGAPLLGGLVAVVYSRWRKLPVVASLDILLACLSGVHIIGRLGCFFAGCCHGRATDLPWGVRFTSGAVDPALRGVPVHPTQLYEAFCELVLFTFLLRLAPKRRFDGQLALTYALAYSVIRFVIEFFRGDPVRGFVFGVLSTSQFLSLLIFAAAATALVLTLRRAPATPVAISNVGTLPSP